MAEVLHNNYHYCYGGRKWPNYSLDLATECSKGPGWQNETWQVVAQICNGVGGHIEFDVDRRGKLRTDWTERHQS